MDLEKIQIIKQKIESKNGKFKNIIREAITCAGKKVFRLFVIYLCDNDHLNKKRVDMMDKEWCSECNKSHIKVEHKGEECKQCLMHSFDDSKNKDEEQSTECDITDNKSTCENATELACEKSITETQRFKSIYDIDLDKISMIKQKIELKNGILKNVYKELTVSKDKKEYKLFVEYLCNNNHLNKKMGNTIDGGWCRQCQKNTIDDAHQLAEKIGWKFLSKTFIKAVSKYLWQCNNGHIFEAKYSNVYSGKGCKQCLMRSLVDLKNKAKERGGECLSTEYTGIMSKYLFKCKNNHSWEARGSSIMNGIWCAECNITYNELTCKKIIEFIYKQPFVKKRPNWLLTDEGNRVELDVYNEKLKVAIEYNGKQHYENVPYFSKSPDDLENRKKIDLLKIKLCTENGVHLIVVPYTVKYKDLYTYILSKCMYIPKDTAETIDYSILNITDYKTDKLTEIQKFIDEKYGGSKILSNYISSQTHMDFECKNKHKFSNTWNNLQAGRFCKECTYDNMKDKMAEKIQLYCAANNLELISKYQYSSTLMEWKCKKCNKAITRSWDSFRKIPHKC